VSPGDATEAFVGLGGNVGDVRLAFARALRSLAADPRSSGLTSSFLYRTPPWGVREQPPFLNMVARILWNGGAEELAERCFEIEREQGRDRASEQRWGPRRLDLDLLLFGEVRQSDPALTLPHPRMGQRTFVLAPLADLAPGLVPPGWEESVAERLASLGAEAELERLEGSPPGQD
jgi:2-amino-4-hydroxy-6-hydroxymethyldihydropteridine diphosphokinase